MQTSPQPEILRTFEVLDDFFTEKISLKEQLLTLPFNPIWYLPLYTWLLVDFGYILFEGFFSYFPPSYQFYDAQVTHVFYVFFSLDIFLMFAYKKTYNNPRYHPASYFTLTLETISLIPFDLVLKKEFTAEGHPVTLKDGLIRVSVPRILRIARIMEHFIHSHSDIGIPTMMVFACELLFYFYTANILCACFAYEIALIMGRGSWKDAQVNITDNTQIFIISLYHSVTKATLRSTEYSYSTAEGMALTTIAVASILVLYTFVIPTIVTHQFHRMRPLQFFVNSIRNQKVKLRSLGCPSELIHSNSEFSNQLWDIQGVLLFIPKNEVLPVNMQAEYKMDTVWPFFSHSHVFRYMDFTFLRHLGLAVEQSILRPGTVVFEKNVEKDRMIYVVSGNLIITSEIDGNGDWNVEDRWRSKIFVLGETPILTIGPGSILGEIALLHQQKSGSRLYADSLCEIHYLSRTSFVKIARDFPFHFKYIMEKLKKRFGSIKAQDREEFAAIQRLTLHFNQLLSHTANTPPLYPMQYVVRGRGEIFTETNRKTLRSIERSINVTRHADLISIAENVIVEDSFFVKNTFPFILNHECVILPIVKFIVHMVTLLNIVTFPSLALTYFWWHKPLEFLIATVYILDVIFKASTAIPTKHGEVIKDINVILYTRLTEFSFWTDIFAALPIDIIYRTLILHEGDHMGYHARVLSKCNRLCKMWVLRTWINELIIIYKEHYMILCVFKCLFYLSTFVYLSSTVMYLYRLEIEDGEDYSLLDMFYLILQKATGCTITSADPKSYTVYLLLIGIHILSFMLFIHIMTTLCTANITRQHHKFKAKQLVASIIDLIPNGPNRELLMEKVITFVKVQQVTGNLAFFDETFQLKEARNESWERVQYQMYKDLIAKQKIFQFVDEEILIELVRVSEQFVLPRGTVLAYAGSIITEIYIIISGYCIVIPSAANAGFKDRIVTKGGSFGIPETILEVQGLNAVAALTDVYVIRLIGEDVIKIFARYPTEFKYLKEAISWIRPQILKIPAMKIINFIIPKDDMHVAKYLNEFDQQQEPFRYQHIVSYEEPYSRVNCTLFRFILSRRTVSPTNETLMRWKLFRGMCAYASIFIRFIPGSSGTGHPILYLFVCFLDIVAWLDIFVQFHIQYYRTDGILITHTLYTATNYLQNNFVTNLIGVLPVHHFFPNFMLIHLNVLFQLPGYIFALEYLLQKRQLTPLNATLFRVLPLAILTFNTIAAILLFFICDFGKDIPASSLYGEQVRCTKDSWMSLLEYRKPLSLMDVYMNGVYITTSTFTLTGLGGLKIEEPTSSVIIIIMVFCGFFCSISVFTQVVASRCADRRTVIVYQEKMRNLVTFLSNDRIHPKVKDSICNYFEFLWIVKKVETIQPLTKKFPLSMREDIAFTIYGKTFMESCIFRPGGIPFIRRLVRELDVEIYDSTGIVCRVNDINDKIFIVHLGKIAVGAPDGEKLLVLTPGSVFGALDNVPMVRSTLNYVADSYSEVLHIKRTKFQELLNRFSDFQKDWKMQTSVTTDYLQNSNTEDVQEELETPYDKMSDPIKKSWREKLIILPMSLPYQIWEFLEITGYCLGSFYVEMYERATFDETMIIFGIQYFFDFWNLIRIFIGFQRAYYDQIGTLITDYQMITQHYRTSVDWKIDIITIIPFDIVKFFVFTEGPLAQYLMGAILRLPKLLRLKYLFMFANTKMDKLSVNIFRVRLFHIMNVLLLLMHTYTCIMLLLNCAGDYNLLPHRDCAIRADSSSEKWDLYLDAYHVIIRIFCGTVMSNISPNSIPILIYLMMLMTYRHVTLSLTAADIYVTVETWKFIKDAYEHDMIHLLQFFEKEQLSPCLVERTRNYLASFWQHEHGFNYPDLFMDMPYYFKEAVLTSLYLEHIKRHRIFDNCHPDFIRQFIGCMQTHTYFNGDYVSYQGEKDETMYFIDKGKVMVLKEDLLGREQLVKTLVAGTMFGLRQGLYPNVPQEYSYMSVGPNTRIVFVKWSRWKHLLDFFIATKYNIYKADGAFL